LNVIRALDLPNEAIPGRIIRVNRKFQNIVLIPNSLRVEHDTAIRNFRGEIPAQTLQILRAGLDGDHLRSPRPQRLSREDSDIRTGIQDDIARLDSGAVDVPLLLAKVVDDGVLTCGRKPVLRKDDGFGLGEWIGRRQAYSLVAGTCSAADARCLHEIRESKKYRQLGLTWEEFCKQRIGMHRTKVDQIIRYWIDFGAAYFTLAQITGITADEFRAIRGAIEDGSLRCRDGAIPIQAEQAPRLLEAVRELAPPPARNPKPPAGAEDGPDPYILAENALRDAHIHIKALRDSRISPEGRRRLGDLVTTLSMELQLLSHLP
jgi:hypothetical protein